MPKTNLRHQVFIDALTSKLWKVLTYPEYIGQWMNRSFEGEWIQGKEVFFSDEARKNQGFVSDVTPGMLLTYSIHHENFIERMEFEIIPASEGLELKFSCSGFADVEEEFGLRLQNVHLQLQKIKWLAEFG